MSRRSLTRFRGSFWTFCPVIWEAEFYFRYLTWRECERAGYTWEIIEAAEHTWKSFQLAVPPDEEARIWSLASSCYETENQQPILGCWLGGIYQSLEAFFQNILIQALADGGLADDEVQDDAGQQAPDHGVDAPAK